MSAEMLDSVTEAMQSAWDEFCTDAGCIPDCFSIRGPRTTRVFANFGYGNFAEMVLQRLVADGWDQGRTGASVGPVEGDHPGQLEDPDE